MCGLACILSAKNPVEEPALRRALSALRHRGPDGEGLWISPDRAVGLGHVRLGIIDLHTGGQPIASEDGQVHIAVNGEFYDFPRIRRDLIGRGHVFRTRTDSEIALHLYEEYGAGCLHHLRGEFALVLWDQKNRTLLAARDRFGVRPLCYGQRDGVLYLASEAKALFAMGLPVRWDPASFFQAASMQYLLPERTLFDGVLQVPPGHYLLARDGQVQVLRYWDMDYPTPGGMLEASGEEEQIAGLRNWLDEAVRLRLHADVPVCFQLSGGLDSSCVVGLAMQHMSGPLDCFSVSFGEEAYDEIPIARETAAHAGATLHTVRVSQRDLMDHLADAVYQSEGLAINGHIAAKFILSRAVRDAGFKVILTGEGADEVLGGYLHLRRDLALAEGTEDPGTDNPVVAGIHLPEGASLPLCAVERQLGFVPSFLQAKATLGHRVAQVLAPDFRQRFAQRDCFQVLLSEIDVHGQLRGRHPVHQSMYLWTRLCLAGYILRTLGDGTEMAHSVEGRLPFLDHVLFEFVRTLPISLKIRGGVEKYVLRKALGPLITDTVRRRQKHPFMAPPLHLRDAFVQDSLRSAAFATVPFFDQQKVLQLLDRLPDMDPRERVATDPVLMMALCAGILQERYHP